MTVDVEQWIAPLSEDNPAGPDLSYDAARQDIEAAFDRSISDDGGSEDDTDWPDVVRMIKAQCGETRDVWLPVYMMRAGARSKNLDTVEAGALLLAGLFENMWDHVHPTLDELGFQGRKGPCESLTRLGEFLTPLRNLNLLEHPRLGAYSGADFERFNLNGETEDGYGMFRAALQDLGDDELNAILARVERIADAIRRADAVLTANAEGDTATNFQPTYDVLAQIQNGLRAFLTEQPEAAGDGMDMAFLDGADGTDYGGFDTGGAMAGGGMGGGMASGPSFQGGINSREDVLRAMDAIADYYARREPGSAVPFALKRAREWVTLDFMAILEDIAPNSIDEARRVLMTNRSSQSSYGNDAGSGDSDSSWSSSSDSSW